MQSHHGKVPRGHTRQHGLLVQSIYFLCEGIVAARLVLAPDDWDLPRQTINPAYASPKHLSAKVRSFVDFMVEYFARMDYERKWTGRFGM